jgi:hypothetical protein
VRVTGASFILAVAVAACGAPGGANAPARSAALVSVPTAATTTRAASASPDRPEPSRAISTDALEPSAAASSAEGSSRGCGAGDPRPSTLRALDGPARIACYASATLRMEAEIVGVRAIIDRIPLRAPARFWPVRLADPAEPPTWLYVTDGGSGGGWAGDPVMTGLELRVSDPALAPASLRGSDRVLIEGHFDDPASAECRRPEGAAWPEITDDTAISMCRAAFIATSISPLD